MDPERYPIELDHVPQNQPFVSGWSLLRTVISSQYSRVINTTRTYQLILQVKNSFRNYTSTFQIYNNLRWKENKTRRINFFSRLPKKPSTRSWSVQSARDRHPSPFGSQMIYNSDYLMTWDSFEAEQLKGKGLIRDGMVIFRSQWPLSFISFFILITFCAQTTTKLIWVIIYFYLKEN